MISNPPTHYFRAGPPRELQRDVPVWPRLLRVWEPGCVLVCRWIFRARELGRLSR